MLAHNERIIMQKMVRLTGKEECYVGEPEVNQKLICTTSPKTACTAATAQAREVSDDTCSILQFSEDSTLLDICSRGLEEISKIALDDYPNEFLTGYVRAVRNNIKRLRGGEGNG